MFDINMYILRRMHFKHPHHLSKDDQNVWNEYLFKYGCRLFPSWSGWEYFSTRSYDIKHEYVYLIFIRILRMSIIQKLSCRHFIIRFEFEINFTHVLSLSLSLSLSLILILLSFLYFILVSKTLNVIYSFIYFLKNHAGNNSYSQIYQMLNAF